MREEVTIITAFFDIGRGNWQGKMQRSNEKYFEYFDFWARIKNKIVVYTEPQYKQKVLDIRRKSRPFHKFFYKKIIAKNEIT